MLTMIGSTKPGQNLIRESATSIKHLSLELGGNAPVIVMDDVDVDKAAKLLC
jgi:succinate-semialdehyde dehydrogenase/glutarate-semialdehyde dehydrogenase